MPRSHVAAAASNWLAGLLLCLALVTQVQAQGITQGEGDNLNLNMKDVEISNLIESISTITGRNFIIDPRVKGKVTVLAPTELTPEEAYQVFLSVLGVHGFTAVPAGSVIKIVPEVNAKQDAIPTATDRFPGKGDEIITRVIPVNNVAAAQLVPILRPLLPQEAHLAPYQPSNVLIASGTAANIERLVGIIRSIDQTSDAEIEVVRLQHASADEVMRILNTLTREVAQGAQAVVGGGMKIVADTRINAILMSGDKSDRNNVKKIIKDLDTPLNSGGNTEVIALSYANAVDLVQVLNGVSSSITGAGGSSAPAAGGRAAPASTAVSGKINIQADEATNSLVINAPPDVMRDLRRVIDKLDVRRAQVLVEAIIAEVSADTARELGVQWGYDGSSESAPVGLINFGGSGSGIVDLASGIITGVPSVGDGLTVAIGDTNGNNGSRVAAMLRALDGDADTNILSTPSLVTMDNQEAEIVVGQNVPFVTGSYTSTGTTSTVSNPFQTIERQDVGLTLRVKPQINEGDTVKLEITQEVSSISSSTTGASDLVTNKRSLKTTVIVDDGSAIVLGGLIDDTVRESIQKVPLLGDIPLLGTLFSYRSTSKVKRNLMIFLHPVILRDGKQHGAISQARYGEMRGHQLRVRERGVHLMGDSDSPLMPTWDDLLALPPSFERWQQSRPGVPRVDIPDLQ